MGTTLKKKGATGRVNENEAMRAPANLHKSTTRKDLLGILGNDIQNHAKGRLKTPIVLAISYISVILKFLEIFPDFAFPAEWGSHALPLCCDDAF